MKLDQINNYVLEFTRNRGVSLLRISVGIVFVWFGALKVLNVSPVVELVTGAYTFFPERPFMLILGLWEVAVGLGLIFKCYLRLSIIFLWLQMGGVFGSLILLPSAFFVGWNPLLITFEGEFLIKNIVILAATLVIWGEETS